MKIHYFDISVNDKVTASKNHVDKNGECESEEEISIVKTTLQFTGKEYKTK